MINTVGTGKLCNILILKNLAKYMADEFKIKFIYATRTKSLNLNIFSNSCTIWFQLESVGGILLNIQIRAQLLNGYLCV
jgi:hypothetical protein